MEKENNNKMQSTALNFNSLDSMFNDIFNTPEDTQQTNEVVVKEDDNNTNDVNNTNDINIENISNINIQSIIPKLKAIEDEMNNSFVERQDLIRIMLLSLVTNSNLLMLGPPGTAKSKISMELCNRIDNSHFFQWLLNKTSDPAELLGTFSIKGMENDQFKRITDGKLPEANIAFIDEIYKCNSPTLNALLSIMNEHIFYNDGKIVPVPLISMFAASNEPPEDESLLAMHDRFLFRIDVEYVHDASNKKRMYNNYLNERSGISNLNNYTTITVEELKYLQDESKKVFVSKQLINKFITLINNLQKNYTINISDRRANECFKVLQGSAILKGNNKVTLDDFNALKYVLWEKKEEMTAISNEISKITNPFDEDFAKYRRQYNEIKEKIDSQSDVSERNKAFFQYQNSLKSIINKMNKLILEASSNGKDVDEFNALRTSIQDYNNNLMNEVLGLTGIITGNDTSSDNNFADKTDYDSDVSDDSIDETNKI